VVDKSEEQLTLAFPFGNSILDSAFIGNLHEKFHFLENARHIKNVSLGDTNDCLIKIKVQDLGELKTYT